MDIQTLDEQLGYDADHSDSRQFCRHGTFIGSWWGPDYMCGMCEDGYDPIAIWLDQRKRRDARRAVKASKVRIGVTTLKECLKIADDYRRRGENARSRWQKDATSKDPKHSASLLEHATFMEQRAIGYQMAIEGLLTDAQTDWFRGSINGLMIARENARHATFMAECRAENPKVADILENAEQRRRDGKKERRVQPLLYYRYPSDITTALMTLDRYQACLRYYRIIGAHILDWNSVKAWAFTHSDFVQEGTLDA